MRRAWPIWLRIAVSVAAVPVIYWPFAQFRWTRFTLSSGGSGPDTLPVFFTTPTGNLTYWIDCQTWPFATGLVEAVVGAILAILIFTALTYLFGRDRVRETRCRRCRELLEGLAEPRCPACGERI